MLAWSKQYITHCPVPSGASIVVGGQLLTDVLVKEVVLNEAVVVELLLEEVIVEKVEVDVVEGVTVMDEVPVVDVLAAEVVFVLDGVADIAARAVEKEEKDVDLDEVDKDFTILKGVFVVELVVSKGDVEIVEFDAGDVTDDDVDDVDDVNVDVKAVVVDDDNDEALVMTDDPV